MKRAILFLLTAAVLMGGCEKSGQESAADELPAETTAAVSETTEQATEMTFPEIDDSSNVSGEYVFDDAGVLSENEKREINKEALYIASAYKINCAVVTVADLKGKAVSDYAGEYYKKLYKGSSGVLFLINNDTGDDYILRKGAPSLFVTNSDVDMLFTEISPLLVTEKYAEASTHVFSALAEKLPQYAIDRTNTFSKEEIKAADDILSAGTDENGIMSVIFTGSLGSKNIDEYTREQYNRCFAFSSGGNALMVINTETAECSVYGTASAAGKEQKELKKKISGCLTDDDGKKIFNCQKAAGIFVDFMSK